MIQVPEGRQIFSDMTVHENLLMGAYSRKKGDNIQPELDEVYELFPGWQSAEIRRAEAFPVVSSRCWQWDGRSWQKPKLLLLDDTFDGSCADRCQRHFATIRN